MVELTPDEEDSLRRQLRKEKSNKYRLANKDALNARQRERYHAARDAVIDAYGAQCACCKEKIRKFLTVDHVNGNGADDRRATKNSNATIYRRIIREGFPATYQVLCFNCNVGKGQGESCPHEALGLRP